MKTLLLTLVVVTIVCLDLGHTMTCLSNQPSTPKTAQTCPDGQNFCYRKRWLSYGKRKVERGCAATCPRLQRGVNIHCCATDNCN
uniref:Three-finger toxin n=1 Tax=Calliophis bivirgatus TaxID=8633 RepID=A0A898IPP4_CALBG|nr:three-finger toxin [Calliophis bivirgatus]